MKVAVFDVGGTFIKYCLMKDDEMSSMGKIPTPQDSQENFLKALKSVLDNLGEVEGIAFSLPGVIDVDKKYIYAGGSLTYNNYVDVKTWEKYFDLPIQVENDARCAAIAELTQGNMQGIDNGLVLTFGTGVGGGIIINGDIYKGSHLIAGEASVIFARKMNEAGSKGLFGSMGSINNLVSKIAKAKGQDLHDGKVVFGWIEDKDEISTQIFEQYCDDVIWQLHNIQCLLDPRRVCIGGGVSENPIFLDGLLNAQARFYQQLPIAFPHAELVACKYCNDANMIGAYRHYIRKNDER